MNRFLVACSLFGVFLFTMIVIAAEKQKVAIIQSWKDSVEDESASQPVAITTDKALAAIWKEWKVAGEVPKIDFTKEIIVTTFTSGSRMLAGQSRLDDKGNLTFVVGSTFDLRPGFRYMLAKVNREGIKTINGKPLPKE